MPASGRNRSGRKVATPLHCKSRFPERTRFGIAIWENNRRPTSNDQAAIFSASGSWCTAIFFAGRNGGSARGGMGALPGSASVATRRESKLRMIIAVSIAWCAGSTVRASGGCFCSGGNVTPAWSVRASVLTEKQKPFRFKAAVTKCRNSTVSQCRISWFSSENRRGKARSSRSRENSVKQSCHPRWRKVRA